MIINPATAVEYGILTDNTASDVNPKDVQPNGLDFRIMRMFELSGDAFTISAEGKSHRKAQEIFPRADGYFHLKPNHQYDISTNLDIDLTRYRDQPGFPAYLALLKMRSTFTRNGFNMTSGVYDTGFKGNIGAVITTPPAQRSHRVAPNTPVGQVLIYEATPAKLYNGQYQNTTDYWRQNEV